MKIESIQTVVLDLPTITPYKLKTASFKTHSLILVRVRSDEGIEGYGEATVIPHYGSETVEAMKVVIDKYLAPALIGSDPGLLESLLAKMDSVLKDNLFAKAAIEMGCVDLFARALRIPAGMLFGGAIRERLRVSWNLSNADADRDIAEAQEKIDQRLHDLFLVNAGKENVRADVSRAISIKRALGYKAKVHVDANQSWDEATATWAIERLEDAGIAVIEQPLHRANIEGMRRLTARFTVPIMADESVDTIESVIAFASSRASDALSIKVTKHGGMLRTRKVASIAESAGMTLFGGTMFESSIGTSAYAHLFSTVRGLDWGCQLFGPLVFLDSITVEQPVYQDFHLCVPAGAGFGMSIDEDKLAFYSRR